VEASQQRGASILFKKELYIDFQFHQFHILQVVDYLAFADETAVSHQFHFRHVMKTISQYHGL
jgi:hypothetical protein